MNRLAEGVQQDHGFQKLRGIGLCARKWVHPDAHDSTPGSRNNDSLRLGRLFALQHMGKVALQAMIPGVGRHKPPALEPQPGAQQGPGVGPGMQHLPCPSQQDGRLPRHVEGVYDTPRSSPLQNRRKTRRRFRIG